MSIERPFFCFLNNHATLRRPQLAALAYMPLIRGIRSEIAFATIATHSRIPDSMAKAHVTFEVAGVSIDLVAQLAGKLLLWTKKQDRSY